MRTRRTRNRVTTVLGRMAMIGLAAGAVPGAGTVHLVSSFDVAPGGLGHLVISTAGALFHGAVATSAPVVAFRSPTTDTPRLAPAPVRAPAPAQAAAAAEPPTSDRTPKAGLGSGTTNWSGYVDTAGGVCSISGRWSVPSVEPSQTPVYSATWLGIDGWNDNSLIQAGTEQDSDGGTDHYGAWLTTSALDFYEQPIRFPVAVDDTVAVSIDENGGTWEIDITDGSAWWYKVWIGGLSLPGASAEWIVEDPTVDGQLPTLAWFTPVIFDQGTVDGASPDLVPSEGGRMYSSGSVATATPSNPDLEDADGFTVARGPIQPPPPLLS